MECPERGKPANCTRVRTPARSGAAAEARAPLPRRAAQRGSSGAGERRCPRRAARSGWSGQPSVELSSGASSRQAPVPLVGGPGGRQQRHRQVDLLGRRQDRVDVLGQAAAAVAARARQHRGVVPLDPRVRQPGLTHGEPVRPHPPAQLVELVDEGDLDREVAVLHVLDDLGLDGGALVGSAARGRGSLSAGRRTTASSRVPPRTRNRSSWPRRPTAPGELRLPDVLRAEADLLAGPRRQRVGGSRRHGRAQQHPTGRHPLDRGVDVLEVGGAVVARRRADATTAKSHSRSSASG